MKRFLTLIIAAALLLCGCGQKGDNMNTETSTSALDTTEAEIITSPVTEAEPEIASEASSGGTPIMRFVVGSDVHFKDYDSVERTRFADMFKDTYAYCDTQEYKSLDAVVIVGDFTDAGTATQYDAFNSVWQSNIKDETQMIVVMGNHEWGNSNFNDFENKTGMEANSDNVIKGFHFIGLSPYSGSDYKRSYDWVEEKLSAAKAEDPEKPIFTFQHHHIRDTVYVAEEWYTDQLDEIYSEYPQSVNFSGHSHAPINDPRSVYQKDYSLFGTGTLSYFECLSGMTYGTIPPSANEAAQFFIVEVYADNSIRLLPFNLLTHDFFHDTNTYVDEQLIWYIDKPSDKSTFRYTSARYKTADKPIFDESDKITISNITAKTADITFTQADDAEGVYSYEIKVGKSVQSFTKSYNIFSEYYLEPRPDTLTYTVGGLAGGTEYIVHVYAYDNFGKRSENPIIATFTTKEAAPFVANTGSGGQFKNTFTDFESYKSFKKGDCFVYNGGTGDGDYWMGAWDSGSEISASKAAIADGKGYKGSKALALSENDKQNQGLYLYANSSNNNLNSFKGMKYLRVWMDLTDVGFRKANFGVFDYDGNLFTTDECDGYTGLDFWYLPEDGTKWEQYEHGGDGCFGDEQDSDVSSMKGWFAFPVKDFTIRGNANVSGYAAGESCSLDEVQGVYMFWDYSDSTAAGTKFYLDEISFVEDYTVFE